MKILTKSGVWGSENPMAHLCYNLLGGCIGKPCGKMPTLLLCELNTSTIERLFTTSTTSFLNPPFMENEKNFKRKTITMRWHWFGNFPSFWWDQTLILVLTAQKTLLHYIWRCWQWNATHNATINTNITENHLWFTFIFCQIDILCLCTATGKYEGTSRWASVSFKWNPVYGGQRGYAPYGTIPTPIQWVPNPITWTGLLMVWKPPVFEGVSLKEKK